MKTYKEFVTELSGKTLGSYVKKASDSAAGHAHLGGALKSSKASGEEVAKAKSRLTGIGKAVDKLTGGKGGPKTPSTNPVNGGPGYDPQAREITDGEHQEPSVSEAKLARLKKRIKAKKVNGAPEYDAHSKKITDGEYDKPNP